MKTNNRKNCVIAIGCLAAFVLWTVAVRFVDVQAIGPRESEVGFATVNGWFHRLTGVHMGLYTLTDWLGLVPLALIFGFGLLGLCQWIRRKHLRNVDTNLLILGGFYLAVMACYLFFEALVINRRPVLIDGALEASYPSSTTLLVMCVMPTARMQLRTRIRNPIAGQVVSALMIGFTTFMVIGRLLCGVHWLTDIIGGTLLGTGLVRLFAAIGQPS